jgi:coproporphyrinogen III oxidase
MEEQNKYTAQAWFHELRGRLCTVFEEIEASLPENASYGQEKLKPPGRFVYTPWHRHKDTKPCKDAPSPITEMPDDGGEMAVMRGRVFEKIGVNISTVQGILSPEFASEIPGADEGGAFWASGISVIAHMRSPFIPAIHMNTRFIVTRKNWFGGALDLNPVFINSAERDLFHADLKNMCDRHDSSYYPKFSEWCERYFYIKHRNAPRGIGGIFYDKMENDSVNWEKNFSFTRDVGNALLEIFPAIIKKNIAKEWSADDRAAQLKWRGLYTEFNLIYDRGTRFGLMTNGNPDAFLVSLPPLAAWP